MATWTKVKPAIKRFFKEDTGPVHLYSRKAWEDKGHRTYQGVIGVVIIEEADFHEQYNHGYPNWDRHTAWFNLLDELGVSHEAENSCVLFIQND